VQQFNNGKENTFLRSWTSNSSIGARNQGLKSDGKGFEPEVGRHNKTCNPSPRVKCTQYMPKWRGGLLGQFQIREVPVVQEMGWNTTQEFAEERQIQCQ